MTLFLYSGILTHSAPLASLYIPLKISEALIFDVSREYRKRLVTCSGFKDPQKQPFAQMFFRIGVSQYSKENN